jgi:hypothetical protein
MEEQQVQAEVQVQVPAPTNDDVIEMAGDLLGTIAIAHGLPVDFQGVTISILREPGTNRLLAAILSPVDMHADEPYPRYQVNPDHVAKPKAPKIVIPN